TLCVGACLASDPAQRAGAFSDAGNKATEEGRARPVGEVACRASSYMEGLLERLAHLVDNRLVVRLAINGGAGNEGIGTSSGNLTNIVLVDATIHFKTNVEVAVVDQATHFLEFLQ